MDMIMIEKSDFDKLAGRIEEIAEHIRKGGSGKTSGGADRWISGREATEMLGVSPRTLQRYRSIGILPYLMLRQKTYYKESDVERFLSEHLEELSKEQIRAYKARIR